MNYLYLHGFVSGPSSQKLNFFKEKFTETGARLVTPDLNGDDFERMTITSQLDIVRRELAAEAGEWTLLGSSMGGYLSTLIAEEEERVKRLVLFAPAFQYVSRNRDRMGAEALAAWRENGSMLFEHHHYKEERPLGYTIIEDAVQYDERRLTRDLPAIIFHGLYDDVVPYELSVEYLREHPATQLVLLGDDHQLVAPMESMWRQIRLFLEL